MLQIQKQPNYYSQVNITEMYKLSKEVHENSAVIFSDEYTDTLDGVNSQARLWALFENSQPTWLRREVE